jgi:hypothetical protein
MCKAPPTAAATVILVKEGAKPLRETKGHNPNHTFCSLTLKTFLPMPKQQKMPDAAGSSIQSSEERTLDGRDTACQQRLQGAAESRTRPDIEVL